MSKFVKIHKKELHKSNCGFDHDPPEQMVRSQWQSRSRNSYYLLYRWAVAIFFTATVITSMSNNHNLHDWGIFFIYLTHWGILLNMITAILGAVLVTLWYYKPDYSEKVNKKNEMPTAFKVYWGFHNTALVTSCVITIIYWGVLHNATIPVNATNLLSHAFNSAIMLLDLLIVGYPMRIFHMLQPIVFGNMFGLFSYIYYLFDGKNMKGEPYIYFVIDWRNKKKCFTTIAAIHVLAIMIHMTLFYLYRLRVFIQRRIDRNNLILPTTTCTGDASLNDSRVSMVFGGTQDGCNNAAFTGGPELERGKA